MNETETDSQGFNRRDFLKGGSAATLMTMLGGMELLGQANASAAAETKYTGPKLKVAVIGLGAWGREIINTLGPLPMADIAAICDNYPAFLKRSASAAPGAKQVADYKALLEDKEIKGVIVATPTHLHKDIAIAALKAGKHVYCEAPLANTIPDAREIALAAKSMKQQVFQAGLQLRADPERHFLVPFIRSGALGPSVMARAQFHKKQSWSANAASAERQKAMNWRLDKDLSLGLMGEIGLHQFDQANWFLSGKPVSVTGWGSIKRWNEDGREVPDTVQAMFEYPGKVYFTYDATIANSFDGEYAVFYGTDSAVMLRESKAWLFKEVDAPLLGWEVYASKQKFYEETGITLVANASKSVKSDKVELPFTNTPLSHALEIFLRNSIDLESALAEAQESFKDDPEAINDHLARIKRRSAAGFLEGFQATVLGVKANEAVVGGKRIDLKPEMYELA